MFVQCKCLVVTMNPRHHWVKLTLALKPSQNRLQSLYNNRSTSTRRWLVGSGAQSPSSSPWTTSRVVLLSVFTSSMTYLYASSASRPPVGNLSTGDRVPKYATTNDFAKACCDCEPFGSCRSLTHLAAGNRGAAPNFIQGCDQH